MGKKLEIAGEKFGRLTAIEPVGVDHIGAWLWRFKCDCGKEVITRGTAAKSGGTTFCGCYHKEKITKHGKTKSKEYSSWQSIKDRCLDEKCKDFYRYGAVGIVLFDGWINDFQSFLDDIGPYPIDGNKYTVDRIDNSRGYEPGNIRWATPSEQARNRSLSPKNNTGHNGVIEYTWTVNGKDYVYICASICVEVGKQVKKNFSLQQMSREEAIEKAVAWREEKEKEAGDIGNPYSDSCNKPKAIKDD